MEYYSGEEKNGMKICRKMVGLRNSNSEVIECHKGRSHVFPHMQNLANNRYLWKPCTCGQSRIWKIDSKKGYILRVEVRLNVGKEHQL